MALSVLQWNVFEDGLTDAPATISFSSDFEDRFNTLLKTIGNSPDRSIYGFQPARDFTQLPSVTEITSIHQLFGFIDVVYAILYHPLGGEARFGETAPGEKPDLRNSLRTMFLHNNLLDPQQAPSASNSWFASKFAQEVDKALGASEQCDEALRGRLLELHKQTYDSVTGVLSWRRDDIESCFKRTNNVFRDKWLFDLASFLSPPADMDDKTKSALSLLLRVSPMGDSDNDMTSLINVHMDSNAEVCLVRTFTLQAALRWLLVKLCENSLTDEAASGAIAVFAGVTAVPSTAQDRASLIFPVLMQQVEAWLDGASLQVRHQKWNSVLEQMAPDIMTFVEYDAEWRRQALPSFRPYACVHGVGSASIVYDSTVFEHVTELTGVSLPDTVRSQTDRGDGDCIFKPKSSCMSLLRRKVDHALVLVVAVHLESAQPSDTRKVQIRGFQMRTILGEIASFAVEMQAAGHNCAILVGGDFNALREEFVFGNGDLFYQSAVVADVLPPLKRPKAGEPIAEPISPPLARIDDDSSFRLLCDAVDGGALLEVSRRPREVDEVVCTRAGKTMVIDFIFSGSVGRNVMATPRTHLLTNKEEVKQAADELHGIHYAVLRWGSDHLPICSSLDL